MKSLYGLKQGPKNWYDKFTDFLKSLDFEPSDDGSCVFYNKDRSIKIVIHVDDDLLVGKCAKTMLKILKKLDDEFVITSETEDDGMLCYLGM